MTIFLEILSTVLGLLSVFLAVYAHAKKVIEEKTLDAINRAEDEEEAFGNEKMEEAIKYVKYALPTAVRPFITDNMLRKVIQKAFDKVKEFASKQK